LIALKHEKAFECENDLPFTNLVTLDMRDWSHGFLANSIVKKRRVQSDLVNRKTKSKSEHIYEAEMGTWEIWKEGRIGKKHLEKYKERLVTDKEFAKWYEEKHHAEKERAKRNKIDQQNRKWGTRIWIFYSRTSLGKTGFF
jgi:hypothetical protein